MRIEVLFFDGCPNRGPAVERVQEVLREEGISAEVVEVNVTEPSMARELRFLGSPTVRANGFDAEPDARAAREYGMMCRTYAANGRREGMPPSRNVAKSDPGSKYQGDRQIVCAQPIRVTQLAQSRQAERRPSSQALQRSGASLPL
jgi:hypothetical protein